MLTRSTSAAYVQGRDRFNSNNQKAHLGVKAFAFMWTATTCLFLSSLFYCLGGTIKKKEGGYSGREERRRGFFGPRRSGSTREYADGADGAAQKETAA